MSFLNTLEMEKFLSRVNKTDTCWLWNGAKSNNGYGKPGGGYAHRIAYRLFKGSIPDGLHICHTCDVRLCVNPDHLFAGTRFDNLQDASSKGRLKGRTHRNNLKTHCKYGHEYTDENTRRKNGHRKCRACGRITNWIRRGQPLISRLKSIDRKLLKAYLKFCVHLEKKGNKMKLLTTIIFLSMAGCQMQQPVDTIATNSFAPPLQTSNPVTPAPSLVGQFDPSLHLPVDQAIVACHDSAKLGQVQLSNSYVHPVGGRGIAQNFQDSSGALQICYHLNGAPISYHVWGWILEVYLASQGGVGNLGYPTSNEIGTGQSTVQTFEKGIIRWNPNKVGTNKFDIFLTPPPPIVVVIPPLPQRIIDGSKSPNSALKSANYLPTLTTFAGPWVASDNGTDMSLQNLHIMNLTNQKGIMLTLARDKAYLMGQGIKFPANFVGNIVAAKSFLIKNVTIENINLDYVKSGQDRLHADSIFTRNGVAGQNVTLEDVTIKNLGGGILPLMFEGNTLQTLTLRRVNISNAANAATFKNSTIDTLVIEDSVIGKTDMLLNFQVNHIIFKGKVVMDIPASLQSKLVKQ